jgi:hypothetical protein
MRSGRDGLACIDSGGDATRRNRIRAAIANHLLGEDSQIRAQMLHQWDQCADADTRRIGRRTRCKYRPTEIGRQNPYRPRSPVGQRDHHIGGTASRSLPRYREPLAEQAVSGIRNRDMTYGPIKNCRILQCSVTKP